MIYQCWAVKEKKDQTKNGVPDSQVWFVTFVYVLVI